MATEKIKPEKKVKDVSSLTLAERKERVRLLELQEKTDLEKLGPPDRLSEEKRKTPKRK